MISSLLETKSLVNKQNFLFENQIIQEMSKFQQKHNSEMYKLDFSVNPKFIIIRDMSQLEDDKLREEQLYRMIFQSGIICHFCKFSQDILRCDILYDESQCKKHLCVRCYKKYSQQHCQADHKYEEHYFKKNLKLASKTAIFEQATKIFQKQHKIRNNPQYQNLDFDLQNLMAYLHMNPAQPQQRVSFSNIDSAVKQSLGDKKKQERKLHTQMSKTKKANYINRADHRNTENGIETCGYNRKYDKGITLVLRAFVKDNVQQIQNAGFNNKIAFESQIHAE